MWNLETFIDSVNKTLAKIVFYSYQWIINFYITNFHTYWWFTGGHRCKVSSIPLYKVQLWHLYKVHSRPEPCFTCTRSFFGKNPIYKVKPYLFYKVHSSRSEKYSPLKGTLLKSDCTLQRWSPVMNLKYVQEMRVYHW